MAELSCLTMQIIEESVSQDLEHQIMTNHNKLVDIYTEVYEWAEKMHKQGKINTKQWEKIVAWSEKVEDLLEKSDQHLMSKSDYFTQFAMAVLFFIIDVIAVVIGLGFIPGVTLIAAPIMTPLAVIFAISRLYEIFKLIKNGVPNDQAKQEFLKAVKEAIKTDPRKIIKKG